jgi:hypothetical protein
MSALKPVTLVLSLSAVGAVLLLLVPDAYPSRERRQAAAPSEPSRAPARVAAPAYDDHVAQELAELRYQVRRLDDHDADADAAPSEPPNDSSVEGAAAEDLQDLEARAALMEETLDLHLTEEPADPEARAQAVAHIAATLAQAEAGGRLLEVDCGRTLCRAHLGFDDLSQRDARVNHIGALMPWDADGLLRSDPDDELELAVYFMRSGHPLPTPDGAS